ncbi:hypothetical protein [Anaeropeptidivorans aminofermentans]|jgi:outer membrane lipoprotein-sorting protein|uniref:hypothetical protein n=1 Tax=Anaeropeptidivorans aminofermentans TaxID=2934315 RepID=UPI0020240A48|nr:hypothetical protein [Anaeropeptidivorans aminofermentans]
MRRLLKALRPAVIFTTLFLCGCSVFSGGNEVSTDASTYEKVQNKLINMKSFETDATVRYISNRNEIEYDTHQVGRSTGEYRIELTAPEDAAGSVTIFDGETIYQFNPRLSSEIAVGVPETPERSEILITSFIKNYLASQEVSVSAANIDEGTATILEAQIPGDHPYMTTEKLWVDNKTLKPLKLVVYDPDGVERLVVTFRNFEYDVELDDSLFTIPNLQEQ